MAKRNVAFSVDKDFLDELKTRLGIRRASKMARLAFTLLDWATIESRNGRIILSSNPKGEIIRRLKMSELEAIRPR